MAGESTASSSAFRFRMAGFQASSDGNTTEMSAFEVEGEGFSSTGGAGNPLMRGGRGGPFLPRFGQGGRGGQPGVGNDDAMQQLMDMLERLGMGGQGQPNGGPNGAGGEKDNLKALEDLLINFEQYDKNKNGALDEKEIQANDGNRCTQKGRQNVAGQNDALMFASVDQVADTEKGPTPQNWAAAWTGMTRQDLTRTIAALKQGKGLGQYSSELRNKIGAERGVDSSPGGFKAYVQNMQASLRARGLIN